MITRGALPDLTSPCSKGPNSNIQIPEKLKSSTPKNSRVPSFGIWMIEISLESRFAGLVLGDLSEQLDSAQVLDYQCGDVC
jgi:hypothetical protein